MHQDSDRSQVQLNAWGAAASAFDETLGLAERVQKLVDQLIGPEPVSEGKQANVLPPAGVLPGLRDRAEEARQRVREAHSALNRLAGEDLG